MSHALWIHACILYVSCVSAELAGGTSRLEGSKRLPYEARVPEMVYILRGGGSTSRVSRGDEEYTIRAFASVGVQL